MMLWRQFIWREIKVGFHNYLIAALFGIPALIVIALLI